MPADVLVTGGSGFLGLHTIIALLERGHHVRATVRSGHVATSGAQTACRSEPGVVSGSPVSSSVFRPERIIGQPP